METRLKSKKSVSQKCENERQSIIESIGEGSQDSTILKSKDSIIMAEQIEVMKEVGRIVADTLTRQHEMTQDTLTRQHEITQEREDATVERFTQLVERQVNCHKRDINILGEQFTKMNIMKEKELERQIHKLTNYDGVSCDFDEWREKTEYIITGNQWDMAKFLEMLPTSLSGPAKRAYDSLKDGDKLTKGSLFEAMRKKIDPQADIRNKDLFNVAKRNKNESVMAFVDRLRMYVKRSGGDPNGHWTMEMMKSKVFDCFSATDCKILRASLNEEKDLETITHKADALLAANISLIGAVSEREDQDYYPYYPDYYPLYQEVEDGFGDENWPPRDYHPTFRGSCWNCHEPGHMARFCPSNVYQEQYHVPPLDMGDVQSNLEPSTPTQPFLDLGDPPKEGPPPNDLGGQIGSANVPATDQTNGGKSSLLVSDKATCPEPKGNGVLDNMVQSSGRRLPINL